MVVRINGGLLTFGWKWRMKVVFFSKAGRYRGLDRRVVVDGRVFGFADRRRRRRLPRCCFPSRGSSKLSFLVV